MNINKNYENLEDSYLFSTIARKVSEFAEKNPDKEKLEETTKEIMDSIIMLTETAK